MRRKLRILYVAYPLLPLSDDSCGGAEQVLLAIEREMRRRGHDTWVAAPEGSRLAGCGWQRIARVAGGGQDRHPR